MSWRGVTTKKSTCVNLRHIRTIVRFRHRRFVSDDMRLIIHILIGRGHLEEEEHNFAN